MYTNLSKMMALIAVVGGIATVGVSVIKFCIDPKSQETVFMLIVGLGWIALSPTLLFQRRSKLLILIELMSMVLFLFSLGLGVSKVIPDNTAVVLMLLAITTILMVYANTQLNQVWNKIGQAWLENQPPGELSKLLKEKFTPEQEEQVKKVVEAELARQLGHDEGDDEY